MPPIDPTKIAQRPIDQHTEVSVDGIPLKQTAAPTSAPRVAQQIANKEKGPIESIADLPKEDEAGNEVQATPDEKPAINFNDFKDAAAIDTTPLVDKTPQKVEEKKVPELETGIEEVPQKEVQQVEKEVVKPETKPEVTEKPRYIYRDKKDLPPRDTTGLPEDLVEHFKNDMSRSTYEKLRPIVLERLQLANKVKELDGKLKSYADNGVPESYYEHPNAFVLHPDYVSNLQTVDKAQTILNHWAAQSEAVKGGSATYQQIHVDQQGNLFTTEAKADQTAESTIMRAMIFSQNQLMQQQANLQAFSKVHQERHNQAIKWVDDLEHKDPAFQIFETAQNKEQFINTAANILKEFHPSFQNNPLARPLAKAKFVIATLAGMLNELGKQHQAATNGQQTATNGQANGGNGQQTVTQTTVRRSANPTNANLGGHNTEAPPDKNSITVDDFNRVKEGY